MSISHEQAHKLIQLNMEGVLSARETATLSEHLRNCSKCDSYARETNEVVKLLPTIMKRHWSAQPVPLSIPALVGRRQTLKESTLLTIRKAALSLVFAALFLSVWQIVVSGPPASPQLPLQVPSAPTPSMQRASSTSTKITLQNCEVILYTVGETDSLASIAAQFSVSEETIREFNHLQTEVVSPSMELLIPICNFTPTGTFHTATYATTYTPVINATTSTPVDRH